MYRPIPFLENLDCLEDVGLIAIRLNYYKVSEKYAK